MWAPTGQRRPFGSPDPSAFTYSKLFSCSGGIPPGGLSVSGDKARGTPLRHRPHILTASSSGLILSLFDCVVSAHSLFLPNHGLGRVLPRRPFYPPRLTVLLN